MSVSSFYLDLGLLGMFDLVKKKIYIYIDLFLEPCLITLLNNLIPKHLRN